MATTKRKKGGRAAATRAKAAARGRAVKKAAPKKPALRTSSVKVGKARTAKPKVATKPKVAAKPRAVAAPKASAKPRRAAAKPAPKAGAAKAPAVESAEIAALKSKFQRERNGLERRLTEAVREIGMLRHHELRAMQLERQLAERDATILRLQQQLAVGERRAAEPLVHVHEVQQSLALVIPASEELDAADAGDDLLAGALDEFEERQLVDDADLASDDDLAADDGDVVSDD
ncbi:MAG: hypothetical protein IT293_18720 [Deltaproteobacteria bacterium]|nr:hypothetical protein [Deltaproteobacteria bacterium]